MAEKGGIEKSLLQLATEGGQEEQHESFHELFHDHGEGEPQAAPESTDVKKTNGAGDDHGEETAALQTGGVAADDDAAGSESKDSEEAMMEEVVEDDLTDIEDEDLDFGQSRFEKELTEFLESTQEEAEKNEDKAAARTDGPAGDEGCGTRGPVTREILLWKPAESPQAEVLHQVAQLKEVERKIRSDRSKISVLKKCVGCLFRPTVKSLLCAIDSLTRDWAEEDFRGTWCRPCASVGRIKFSVNIGNLSAVQEWIESSPENRDIFIMYVGAWFEMKKKGVVTVKAPALDEEVRRMNAWLTTVRDAAKNGVPMMKYFKPSVVVDLHEAERIVDGNVFMAGGRIVNAWKDGKLVLAVKLPIEAFSSFDVAKELLQADAVGHDIADELHALGVADKGLRCEDENYANLFIRHARDYVQIKAATRSDGRIPGAAAAATCSTVSLCGPGQMLAQILSGGGTGAGAGSNKDDGSDGASTGSKKDGQSSQEKRKQSRHQELVDSLKTEVLERMMCVSGEDWPTLLCDKKIEGVKTRVSGQKAKFESGEGIYDHTAMLNKLISWLDGVINFGNVHKKNYMKAKQEAKLAILYNDLVGMKETFEDEQLKHIEWHPSLRLLGIEISSYSMWQEKKYDLALKELHVGMVARLHAQDTAVLHSHQVTAITFILEVMEKRLNTKFSTVRCDKRFIPSLEELYNDLRNICLHIGSYWTPWVVTQNRRCVFEMYSQIEPV
jgi:hypothetical protein